MRSFTKFVTQPSLYVWLLAAAAALAVLLASLALAPDAPARPRPASVNSATATMSTLVAHTQTAAATGHDPSAVAGWATTTALLAGDAADSWAATDTAKGTQVAAAASRARIAADRLADAAHSGADPHTIDTMRADVLTAVYQAGLAAGPGYTHVPGAGTGTPWAG